MCSRLFHAGISYRVDDVAATLAPYPEPDFELRDRFVRAAILGDAAHLREDNAAPEAFQQNYGRTYQVALLENAQLRAVVVPELGGRLYALQHKQSGTELLQVMDMVRYVNYFPYGAGYAFSLDPDSNGRGAIESYRIVEQTEARAVVEALLPGELVLRNEYILDDQQLSIRHRFENRGAETATITPMTRSEWNLAAFGQDAEVSIRQTDGSWHSFALNPERRNNRDLVFDGKAKPAGLWQITSSALPLVLSERFDAEQVQSTRLVLSGRRGSVYLQLYFEPVAIAPGESITLGTAWQFASGGLQAAG
jgi:hypothetical protein